MLFNLLLFPMVAGIVQEVFHVYLNKFEIDVSHVFLVLVRNNNLHWLIRSRGMLSHQENIS